MSLDIIPENAPLCFKLLVGIVGFVGAYYCIKRSEMLTPPSAAIKAKKQTRLLGELEKLLLNLEAEYHKLGAEAASYPLRQYERKYLVPISNYNQAKLENREHKLIETSNELIIKGITPFYKNNPQLMRIVEKAEQDHNTNLGKLKKILELIDDEGLSEGIRLMQDVLMRLETVRILYELYRNKASLSAKDVKVNQELAEQNKRNILKAKRLIYKRIVRIKTKSKIWIWLFG